MAGTEKVGWGLWTDPTLQETPPGQSGMGGDVAAGGIHAFIPSRSFIPQSRPLPSSRRCKGNSGQWATGWVGAGTSPEESRSGGGRSQRCSELRRGSIRTKVRGWCPRAGGWPEGSRERSLRQGGRLGPHTRPGESAGFQGQPTLAGVLVSSGLRSRTPLTERLKLTTEMYLSGVPMVAQR